MAVSFKAAIGTSDYAVDMQSGLDTLKGTSDAMTIIAISVLEKKVPQKLTKKVSARTKLRRSFKGSYGMNFEVEVVNEDQRERLAEIGEETLAKITSYYIYESLYLEPPTLSAKANAIIEELSEIEDDLLYKLRNPMIAMHHVCKNFGHPLRIDYVKDGNQEQIARLTQDTSENLTKLERDVVSEDFEVIITRFNSFTGNGRLVIKGQEETVAFGFGSNYAAVNYAWKKLVSDNLHTNNSVAEENWTFIEIEAQRMKLKSGRTVKLLIKGITG